MRGPVALQQNGQKVFALSMSEAVFPSVLRVPAVPTRRGSGREKTCLGMLNVVLWTLLSPPKESWYHLEITLGSCEGTCHSISVGTQGAAGPQGLGQGMGWAPRGSGGVGWRDMEQLMSHLACVLI